MARAARRTDVNECRRCASFCDRVIAPATCVEAACPALYVHDDALTGRRYMGCLHKVFECEIDTELFAQAERSPGGFGTVRVSGLPRPQCAFSVEAAWEGGGACVNRRFFDWPDAASDALRAFDLRDRLTPS